jgi:hypothetical protein
MHRSSLHSFVIILTLLGGAACGDVAAPPSSLTSSVASRSGGTGGGGGGGGGGGTVTSSSILPTTPPAPGILVRESFGQANQQRPAGGKGSLRDVFSNTNLGGFWLEYPGSKDTQWLTPDVGQSWKFAGCSDNPLELPSPLEPSFQGCVVSQWADPPTAYPTALMPITVTLPSAGYELSMEGYPAPIAGGYIAIGFTNSGALTSNLTSSGSLWLRVVDTTRFGVPLHYELRTGSLSNGQIIASGDAGASGYNQMAIRYSPASGTVTLSFAGQAVGTFPVSIAPPRYLAFEGVGVLDDLVLRQ